MMDQNDKPHETAPAPEAEMPQAGPAAPAPLPRRVLDVWPPIEAVDDEVTGHIWPAVRQFPPEAALPPEPAWPGPESAMEATAFVPIVPDARAEAGEVTRVVPAWPGAEPVVVSEGAVEAGAFAPVVPEMPRQGGEEPQVLPAWPGAEPVVVPEGAVEAGASGPVVAEMLSQAGEVAHIAPAWPEVEPVVPEMGGEEPQTLEARGADVSPVGAAVVERVPGWLAAEVASEPLVMPPLPALAPEMSAAPPAEDKGLGEPEAVSEPQPVGEGADISASNGTESAATAPLDMEERDPSAYLTALGSALRPAFSVMVGRIPKLRYAVLCTPDGFNVCSTGVGNEQIGKMAAVSSSLLVVGEALVNAATGQTELDVLTMESQGVQIVSTRISANGHSIILLICARTPLGVILVNVKSAVPELRARMELVN
ncbi:hypothetical protein [Acidocella sp.]|nr:hypothetical protein [Acidocella sp.]